MTKKARPDPEPGAAFPMRTAVHLTGLSERQIRYLEEKGLLRPVRSEHNQRLYTPEDIARLREIQRLRHLGLTLRKIQELYAASGPAGKTPPRS